MGRATSIGALSVPPEWTSATTSVATAGTAMHVAGSPAVTATPTRFELRSTVIPFTPAAG
jgi:hypothetical protein